MFKTAAIINFWDGGELLPYAVRNWFKCVDRVIIVFSDRSNYGETLNNTEFLNSPDFKNCDIYRCEPISLQPADNERRRRNFGIDKARELGVTHFVMADVDEFYDPDEFKTELKRFENPNLKGLVCACQTYFAKPTLTIGIDQNTRVTFIHKLLPGLRFTWNKGFPFAWDNGIKIDPTRQLNINDGVEWSNIVMHHYSWVRKDYQLKIRNSTARPNIEKQNIWEEIRTAKEGYFCFFYQKHLTTAPNRFNLPVYGEILDENIRVVASADQVHKPGI